MTHTFLSGLGFISICLLKRLFLFNLLLRCNNQNHPNQTIKTVFHVQTHDPHKVVTSLFGHIQKALSVAASRTCRKHPRLSFPVRERVKNHPVNLLCHCTCGFTFEDGACLETLGWLMGRLCWVITPLILRLWQSCGKMVHKDKRPYILCQH